MKEDPATSSEAEEITEEMRLRVRCRRDADGVVRGEEKLDETDDVSGRLQIGRAHV